MEYYPNILLISGTGRNVGKTLFACRIIERLSVQTPVVGLKISPHLHELNPAHHIILATPNYKIIEETVPSDKDSWRMKKAGASKVYYIQSDKTCLVEAFNSLKSKLKEVPVICESGGLRYLINPGLFFLITNSDNALKNNDLIRFKPIVVHFQNNEFTFDIKQIVYEQNVFNII